jgi:hypothetical protein
VLLRVRRVASFCLPPDPSPTEALVASALVKATTRGRHDPVSNLRTEVRRWSSVAVTHISAGDSGRGMEPSAGWYVPVIRPAPELPALAGPTLIARSGRLRLPPCLHLALLHQHQLRSFDDWWHRVLTLDAEIESLLDDQSLPPGLGQGRSRFGQ